MILISRLQITPVLASKLVQIWLTFTRAYAQVNKTTIPSVKYEIMERVLKPSLSSSNLEIWLNACYEDYPIVSIEDPFDQDDWDSTKTFTSLGICQVAPHIQLFNWRIISGYNLIMYFLLSKGGWGWLACYKPKEGCKSYWAENLQCPALKGTIPHPQIHTRVT